MVTLATFSKNYSYDILNPEVIVLPKLWFLCKLGKLNKDCVLCIWLWKSNPLSSNTSLGPKILLLSPCKVCPVLKKSWLVVAFLA